jgi:adenosine deaminase
LNTATTRDLRELPKAHLHLHLEGSMRPATLVELAQRYGIEVPTISGDGSFDTFAALYRAACRVVQTPDDLCRLVLEVAEDGAEAGAVWVEPAVYLGRYAGAPPAFGGEEGTIEILLAAAQAAEKQTGVGVGIMISGNRTRPPQEAERLARIAASHAGNGVVAFGLADDEARFPPEPFAAAFAIASAAGLLCTPHAGELAGPASVRGALDALGARRIQHGVRAIEDLALVERLEHDGVCLDVCPTSNLLLSVVARLDDHPLPALIEAGLAISVNSDDPLFFGSGLLGEYELCRQSLSLDDDCLAHVAVSSIRSSGASDARKAIGLLGVDRWLGSGP